MVDSVGLGNAGPLDRAGGPRVGSLRASDVRRAPGTAQATPSAVAMLASRGVPLDMELVGAVRAAIADGRYAVDPDAIAARMMEIDLPHRS